MPLHSAYFFRLAGARFGNAVDQSLSRRRTISKAGRIAEGVRHSGKRLGGSTEVLRRATLKSGPINLEGRKSELIRNGSWGKIVLGGSVQIPRGRGEI